MLVLSCSQYSVDVFVADADPRRRLFFNPEIELAFASSTGRCYASSASKFVPGDICTKVALPP